ncbi:hypothetical protein JOF53_005464 [Crossiella equi]|uniref:Uncharacterized protein n=1 Tax=Crossiella equi TaxID=130796 RepID=A0ABS5AJN8_9PSEU|nr:hypothetical protein [Crossiella equi]MBP2476592.1 hypothetical protein [Crossiella equi]
MNAHGELSTLQIFSLERPIQGFRTMHLYEELSKVRIQEAHRVSRERRLACQLASARRWRRVSQWAARLADKHSPS